MTRFARTAAMSIAFGHRGRVHGNARWLRTLAVFGGLLALQLCFISLAVTALSYQRRMDVGQARAPFASEEFVLEQNRAEAEHRPPSIQPSFLYALRGDTLADGFQFDIAVVADPASGAEPPPGLDRWPLPGQVFLSPALVADGEDELIANRYGTLVGLISDTGLSAPDERFAYVNPKPGTFPHQSLVPYQRFGSDTERSWFSLSMPSLGEAGYIYPAAFMIATIICLALVPALVLIVAARSMGGQERRQRYVTFRVLGATPTSESWARFGDVAIPTAVASVVGIGVAILITRRRIVVPFTRFELPQRQLQEHAGGLVAVATVAIALGLIILIAEPARRQVQSTSLGLANTPIRRWTYTISPAGYIAALWVPSWLDPAGRTVWQLTYFGFVLIGLLGMPFLLNSVTKMGSRALAVVARRNGWPEGLVAGRLLASHPTSTVVLMATICMATGILFQGLFFGNAMQDMARRAIQISKSLDGRVAVADFDYGIKTLPAIRESLRGRAELATLTLEGEVAQLTGTCPALYALGVRCSPGMHDAPGPILAFAAAPNEIQNYNVTVAAAEFSARDGTAQRLLIVSSQSLDLPAVQAAVIQNGWPNSSPSSPAFGFAGSALANANQSRWMVVFGLAGVVFVVAAIGLANLNEYYRRARELAPMAAFTPTPRPFVLVAFLLLFVPLCLAGSAGVGLAVVMAQVPVSIGLTPPYGGEAARMILVAVWCFATASAVAGSLVSLQAAAHWRSGHA